MYWSVLALAPIVPLSAAGHTVLMHGAMDTLRMSLRLGAYVFVLLAVSTSVMVVMGPVEGSLHSVFRRELLIRVLSLELAP